MSRHPNDAGHGGKLEPDRPKQGDRFRVLGRSDVLTVDVLELAVESDDGPTRFLVRAPAGSRWTLVARDPILDGIAYVGTPLVAHPSDPEP